MKQPLFVAIVISSILVLCNWSTSSARRSCSQSANALGAALQRLIENDNAKNLEGLLGGYTDDAILLPPRGENVAV